MNKKKKFQFRHVYNYCTNSRHPQSGRNRNLNGANFVGEDLYNKLKDFLSAHMEELLKVFLFSSILNFSNLFFKSKRLQKLEWMKDFYIIIIKNGNDIQLQWAM